MMSSAAGLMEIRAQAERDSGVGLKPFGIIPESVFTLIPESCSCSSRNSVRNHPGIAFTLPRIPHAGLRYMVRKRNGGCRDRLNTSDRRGMLTKLISRLPAAGSTRSAPLTARSNGGLLFVGHPRS